MQIQRFARFSWFTLAFTVAVILWGAYVRATGSGAGCGNHWPLCNGEVIPRSAGLATLIEFTHRSTSGLALMLVVILVIWAFRLFPGRSLVRRGAFFSLVFMVTEALVGAALVLFELVGQNDSFTRAAVMAVHLMNTFFLLAALTLTSRWAESGQPLQFKQQKRAGFALMGMLALLLILGASGAVTALGDTLFPSGSLEQALRADFSPTAHLFIRLRLYHPAIALLTSVAVIFTLSSLGAGRSGSEFTLIGRGLAFLILLQLGAGFLNVWLLAPVWLQMVHLLLADLIWIVAILFSTNFLQHPKPEYSHG